MINGYDSWKLSNPWDDNGDEEIEIQSDLDSAYHYKYPIIIGIGFKPRWVFGVLMTDGNQIEISEYSGVPNIKTDIHEVDQLNAEVERLEKAHTDFECISENEFAEHYNAAIVKLTKTIRSETRL